MTKVAITGASGFIGSYLLPELLREGFRIKVLDFGNGSYLDGVEIIKGNLQTGDGVENFLKGSDVVIHLAGQVLSGITSMEEGNTKTTSNLITSCYKHNVKRIIFSSSVAVYGDSNGKIFKETDKCAPNTEYGQSKLIAEKIVRDWSEKTGGESVIFRFFSIYGPENKKGVIYNLCRDFIDKGSVTVFGNGRQRRDLVFVKDVAELLTMSVAGNLSGIYNVGSGKYYSVLDLISILERVSGRKCKILFEALEEDKVGEILYSTDKIKRETGWSPLVEIEDGMRRTYEFLLRNR